ncbi:hypothetical protein D3C81_1680770 [compost metagenome]
MLTEKRHQRYQIRWFPSACSNLDSQLFGAGVAGPSAHARDCRVDPGNAFIYRAQSIGKRQAEIVMGVDTQGTLPLTTQPLDDLCRFIGGHAPHTVSKIQHIQRVVVCKFGQRFNFAF